MISVRHLKKTYTTPNGETVQVLKDVSCDISKGEVISIIGPSGTGKSTFLRALNLLDPPTGGEILVDGENILQKNYPMNRLRQRMGMVFQSFNLFDHLTILQNVTLGPIKLLGMNKQDAENEAMHLLRKVGMAEKASVMPSSLSGGQKQRVAIARCLAMHPEIILFDEPTSALDPTMVGEVLSVIRQLAKEGMTMLIVTHEMKFARDVSTRIFFMNKGIIYEDGTPEQIFDHPLRKDTQAFIRRIRSLRLEVNGADYDIYGFFTEIDLFCAKYALYDKCDSIKHVVEEMLATLLSLEERPLFIELAFSELDYSLALTFMVTGLFVSPLNRELADPIAVSIIQGVTKSINEEKMPNGYRLTFSL
ncbi:MAG: amino acid ABC transporter ATP-binding protein [Bacteroidaceae bacterium]|nr:amino acid ABC transporter ATP-binding protein [Bacteroidaceae bacterium]